MTGAGIHAVTGAFGYSGQCIARRLLEAGRPVITLTNAPASDSPFGGRVRAFPLRFDQPGQLAESLAGVSVLYNTYWVRFSRRGLTHADAARNTRVLFDAARMAGVKRIVHISIANPSPDSPLEYFRHKAELERALAETGISHAILRPTILFGHADILVNNIAWALRRLPVFAVFGDGRYRIRPVHVEDLARLAVEQGEASANTTVNAIGPEAFTYREFVQAIGRAIGRPRPMATVPVALGYAAGWFVGKLMGDVLLTRDEIRALTDSLLFVDAAPTGRIRLTEWAAGHGAELGVRYARGIDRQSGRIAK